jgi:hypothetical protein
MMMIYIHTHTYVYVHTHTHTHTNETYSLLLEPLHNLLVRFVDALRLVVLDHCLVKPVLQRSDVVIYI